MRLNADFDERVVIRPDDYDWVASPMPGVERMMLDRIGDEVARATSLVRYAPNSTFSRHVHGGGEEFFVLEGEFGDEHDAYPAGTYVRNPIGTAHSPHVGANGCVIFVKLQQFEKEDQQQFALDTRSAEFQPGPVDGIEVLQLHKHGSERVSLIRWAPNTTFERHTHNRGEEVFVISGAFYDDDGDYPAGTWIRSPHGSEHAPFTKDEGALVYVKVGHLPRQ
ncbi:MAG: cupin domain-containing protein [Woeseiaceae bacterium]|nr:cupin domain-containing protein [Woeseiaceae bacterium]